MEECNAWKACWAGREGGSGLVPIMPRAATSTSPPDFPGLVLSCHMRQAWVWDTILKTIPGSHSLLLATRKSYVPPKRLIYVIFWMHQHQKQGWPDAKSLTQMSLCCCWSGAGLIPSAAGRWGFHVLSWHEGVMVIPTECMLLYIESLHCAHLFLCVGACVCVYVGSLGLNQVKCERSTLFCFRCTFTEYLLWSIPRIGAY